MTTKELATLQIRTGCRLRVGGKPTQQPVACARIYGSTGTLMHIGHQGCFPATRDTLLKPGTDLVCWAIAWAKAHGYVLDNVDYETATIKEG